MTDTMQIEKDPALQDMFLNRNLKPTTKTNYIKTFKDYCSFIGLTPNELIEEAEDEEEKGIRKKNRKIKQYFIRYQNYMLEKKLSPLTIKIKISMIRSFYNEYEIELPKYSLKLEKEQELITNEDIISIKHIKKALKHSNNKYKAVILLMMSSGMSSNEVRHLKVSDFLKSIELEVTGDFSINNIEKRWNGKDTGFWSIKRIKTGMPYFTFSSHESIDAIITFLKEREFKQGKIDVDSFLFDVNSNQTAAKSMFEYFRKLNKTCNFGFLGRQSFFRSHMLRKFFASKLYEKGIQQLNIDWLLGHRVNDITGAYFKPNINSLKNEYLQVLPYLCVEEVETRTIESTEFKELKEKYETDSTAKDEEINVLKEEIRLTRKLVEKYIGKVE